MTLLAAFQGERCALVASDIMLTFVAEDQLSLPREEREYQTFVIPKFRPLANGDLLAFHGALRSAAIGELYTRTLNDFLCQPLCKDSGFKDVELIEQLYLCYASVKDSQIYFGEAVRDIERLFLGSVSAAGIVDDCRDLIRIAESNRRIERKYDKRFLRELSDSWERYFTDAEKSSENFGGYESYIITPGDVRLYRRNLGKLNGCKEALADANGRIWF